MAVSKSDSPRIAPDYRKPVEEVYAQVTRYFIDKWQNLVLANIPDSSRNRLPNLPSWIIDFSVTGVAAMSESYFDAASAIALRPLLAPPANWRQLRVEGLGLDRVVETGNTFREGNNPQLRFDPAWCTLVSNMDRTYFTGEPRCDVLWRTLCLDQDLHTRSPAPMEYRDQFREVVSAIVCAEGEKKMAKKAATVKVAHIFFGNTPKTGVFISRGRRNRISVYDC